MKWWKAKIRMSAIFIKLNQQKADFFIRSERENKVKMREDLRWNQRLKRDETGNGK